MLKITNTRDVSAQHIKVLVHGAAGAGKTRLCGTTGGTPLIINAEGGLLSLAGQELDVFSIKGLGDLNSAYEFLVAGNHKYDWVCLDSISEIAEVVLAYEKEQTKDPRKAYGEMQDTMTSILRKFRDLPMNVYFAAKQSKVKDETTGALFYSASMPGQKLGQDIPFFFDEVFALHSWRDSEGNMQQALQTQRDGTYEAKDRSGALDMSEPANLAHIAAKILKKTNKTTKTKE